MPQELLQFMTSPFAALPGGLRRRAFGVDYAQVEDGRGGRMFVTRHGWPLLEHLCPVNWWDRRQYVEQGERMMEGTGAVYRIAAPGFSRPRRVNLIAKFSRFAQNVPLQVATELLRDVPASALDNAAFLSPFEEFGLVEELRSGAFGPAGLRVRTKRPLAIYSTPPSHPLWRLGRLSSWFHRDAARLAADQDAAPVPVTLQQDHEYIVLYDWVDGDNATECHRRGLLSTDELHRLTARVTRELHAKGFRVLDNKPAHFILRTRSDGTLLRRDGELVYALVDFELLERTEEHERSRRGRLDATAAAVR